MLCGSVPLALSGGCLPVLEPASFLSPTQNDSHSLLSPDTGTQAACSRAPKSLASTKMPVVPKCLHVSTSFHILLGPSYSTVLPLTLLPGNCPLSTSPQGKPLGTVLTPFLCPCMSVPTCPELCPIPATSFLTAPVPSSGLSFPT